MSASSIGTGGRVVAAPHVRFRLFDDELVIVDLNGGEYFALDRIGSRMWQELVSGKSPAEVAAELAGQFDATEERIAADCAALADELLGRRLVVARLP
jgi:hypothetical protein